MKQINNYKDLAVWQKSINLVVLVYSVTDKFPQKELFALTSQLRRAAVSVPSNIAEGFELEGNKELMQFLTVAKASTAEVQTQLRIAFEVDYITADEFTQMDDICIEVISLISGFLRYLRSTSINGKKFKRN